MGIGIPLSEMRLLTGGGGQVGKAGSLADELGPSTPLQPRPEHYLSTSWIAPNRFDTVLVSVTVAQVAVADHVLR